MKTILTSLSGSLLILTLLFCSDSPAQSAPEPHFSTFKMVASNDPASEYSRTTRSSFSLEETPFLYVKLSEALTGSIKSFWAGLDDKIHTRSKSIKTTSGQEFWLSLVYWETDKQEGPWTVKGQLWSGTTLVDQLETGFVITPEPGALMLYLIGGIPVAVRILRRKVVTDCDNIHNIT
jgi:hypothetical protein